MFCANCRAENSDERRFCGECGAKLDLLCPDCGFKNQSGVRYCGGCGVSLQTESAPAPVPASYTPKHLADRILTSQSALAGERKQVTVLFADIKGSLELIEGSDPELAHGLLDAAIGAMMNAVHRYEGTVNKVLGDGIMALFGAPLAHEDHALRACYAALAMQEAIKRAADEARSRYGVEPQIRVGLNSGEVVVRAIGNDLSMDYDAIGPTTHLAGRMEQLALPGTIRLAQNTLHLTEGLIRVKSLGPVPIKGLERPVEVYELEGALPTRTRFQAAVARGLTCFVGRDTEIEALGRALDRAMAGHGQIFAVVGEAGVGKSRLYYEFTHSHRTEGMLIIENRSASYGKATAYFPVIDLLKNYFDIQDRDDARRVREKVTGKLLTLDENLRSAMPALLALLDASTEDLAWEALEPTQRRQRILDAVRMLLLRESRIQPLVVVFEDLHWIDSESQAFLDSFVESLPTAAVLLLVNYRPEYQHSWGSKTYYTQRRIDPLSPASATELLDGLLGQDPELALLKRMLVARTEGNPFFVEESVRSLVEAGALRGGPGNYRLTRDVASIDVPSTVQDVLVARIDRLPHGDKQLLQAASVIGKDVPYTILQLIAELPEDSLRQGLANLKDNEFLYETRLFPDLEYTFKHAHTYEVTYGSLLAERRRRLHQRIVDAIETLYADRLAEQVERLAHHAFRGELWKRSVSFLRQSAEKAAARSAYREASASLEQSLVALGHLPSSDEACRQNIDLRFELRSALQALGEHEGVFEHLREAEAQASALGDQDRLGWASSYLSQYLWRMGEPAHADDLAERALSIAKTLNDFELRVVTQFFLGQGKYNIGDYRGALEPCRCNLEDLQGEKAHERLGLTGLPSVLSRIWLAWSLGELGEFREAMVQVTDALSIAETANHPYSVTAASLGIGHVHLVQGHLDQAIAVLERAIRLCDIWDLGVIEPTAAGLLGLAYALSGRFNEALPLLEAGETPASPVRIFDTPSARLAFSTGLFLAGRGDEAMTAAQGALEFASERGFRGCQARAELLLGDIAALCNPSYGVQAEGHYRKALALADELEMRPVVAHCYFGLGRLLKNSGSSEGSESHIETAEAMYRDMEMGMWLSQAQAEWKASG